MSDTMSGDEESLQSSHSAWMGHWMQLAGDSTKSAVNRTAARDFKLDCDDASRDYLRETEARAPENIIESSEPCVRNMRNDGNSSSPPFTYAQESDEIHELRIRRLIRHNLDGRTTLITGVHSVNEYASLESHSFARDPPSKRMQTHDSDSSAHRLPTLGQEGFTGLFKSQYIALGRNDAVGVDIMRIDSALDMVEEMAGDCSVVPQTTQNLSVTKRAHMNMLKENFVIRNSTVVTRIDADKASLNRGRAGVELHSLSSIENNEEDKVGEHNASKVIGNRTSAETDPMEIDSREDKNLENIPKLGAFSTESYKDLNIDLNLPPHMNAAHPREVRDQSLDEIMLPYSNEGPALQGVISSFMDPGSSTIPSSKMEKQLQLVDQPRSPDMRWDKRFKMTSDTSKGTIMSEIAERDFRKVTKRPEGEGREKLLLEAEENKGNESSSPDAWIKRWRPNGCRIIKGKSETTLVRSASKSHRPSVGAIAMMGKTASFKPCVLQKNGFVKFWNA